ncbi:MAG TPA: hypothetical protein VJ771_08130 [Candidatus Nitrosotalea sp.]|nr:hypothetical protein [Candidatus Nitrosotalea sp.]
MKNINIKSKQTSVLFGVIAMVAIVTLSPQAFAQQNPAGQGQQNGIPLGSSYNNPQAVQTAQPTQQPLPNPAGQGQQNGIPLGSSYGGNSVPSPATPNATTMGWSSGIVVIGIMSGIGVWTAVRKH